MRLALLAVIVMNTTISAADPVVLVIHGGAGVLTEAEMNAANATPADYEAALAQSLSAGWAALQTKTGADAVEAAIRVMEDSPLFNAGKGAALTRDGHAELDASMMEGRMVGSAVGKLDPKKRAGAVTGVMHVKNPIAAARAVMEMEEARHSILAGLGAEEFVLNDVNRKKYGIDKVDNAYFWTDRRLKQVQPGAKQASGHDRFVGTVGAVALSKGTLVAGTSTGGTAKKWPGRIGDTPVFGAGTYADDRAAGVSCTGTGELFLRHVVAHDVCARMRYKNIGVVQAGREAIDELPDMPDGVGGLIALDTHGVAAFPMSALCTGMYRGYVTEKGDVFVAVYAKDPWKPMDRKMK